MSILSRLFRLFKGNPAPEHPASSQRNAASRLRIEVFPDRSPRHSTHAAVNSIWLDSKQTRQIAGLSVGGWVYWGSNTAEPSSIDASLHAKKGIATELGYYPSYARMSPAQRYTYLDWLSRGRESLEIDIGYVFVFFYGLERRILTHLLSEPQSSDKTAELHELYTELTRLRSLFADSSDSFGSYTANLLGIIEYSADTFEPIDRLNPPSLSDQTYDVPLSVRAAIGKFSDDQTPIPAEWAVRWAWFYPETRIRTPARRLSNLFEKLFAIRYYKQFGEGLIVQPAKRKFDVGVFTANVSVRNARIPLPQISNTFELKRPARLLMKIFDDVTEELDAHSRWIGRNPENTNQLVGLATVPHEILDTYSESIESLDNWLQETVTNDRALVVDVQTVLSRLSQPPSGNLNKAESTALAHVLGALGVGIEPDTRLAGPSIRADEKIAIFRTDRPTSLPQSSTFEIASVILHLAAVVSSADGTISPDEVDTLSHHLRSNLQPSEIEEQRLFGHLLWLSSAGVKLSGIKRRLSTLDVVQRKSIGDLLVAVAVSDTSLPATEVTALKKIFKLLGLDVEQVHSRLHSAITSDSATTPLAHVPVTPGYHKLDPALLQRTQDETLAVSRILADIFEEEVELTIHLSEPEPDGSIDPKLDGLDLPHATLLTRLVNQDRWSSADFQTLCDDLHLIPIGAIDVINEFSIDSVEEPIIEPEDNAIIISPFAKEELFND